MSKAEEQLSLDTFRKRGEEISNAAGVRDTMHEYFFASAPRLWRSLRLFDLIDSDLGDVLEIGPFFGYVPFALRCRASSYTVLEGRDPVVEPLMELYRERDIACSYIDFFDRFGPVREATHCLDLKSDSLDRILCWETMEHFGFNPVKFVRELLRVLRPGGSACITVPNSASFQNLVGLATGRGEQHKIDGYFAHEDYECNGRKAFYGFHWREYTTSELRRLFERAGFEVRSSGSFTASQDRESIGLARRLARGASSAASALLPRFGPNAYIWARKPDVSG